MTQITHEEARALIQFNLDQAPASDKEIPLREHLSECARCEAYEEELLRMETDLRRALRQRWKIRPSLELRKILSKGRSERQIKRALAYGLSVAALLFGALIFARTETASPSPTTVIAFPVPTPSTFWTRTSAPIQDCALIKYTVQEGDTLESVALRFSVPKEEIIAFNGMESESVQIGARIVIPLCDRSPTGTIYVPSSTNTIAPSFEPTTSTPG
jgi:LysM repeat protein